MTAFDRPAEARGRDVFARLAAALAELRTLPSTLRATEYIAVGQGARFRAVQRRRTRTASRAGFLVVSAAILVDLLALLELDLQVAWLPILLDVAVIAGAIVGRWLLAHRYRQYPEAVAWVVTSALVLSTVATGLAVTSLTVQSVAYLLMLPALVALVMPWSTGMHLRWLLAYVAMVAAYLVADPGGRFLAAERDDLLVVITVAVGVSLAGHVLLKQAQIRSFAQLESIRELRRRADADMVELERVHHALELTARIDPLTGAGNRRRLDEDLRAVRAHVHRSGLTYGLIEIDIDYFKRINDQLGHIAGDAVLRDVVDALQGTLRATDAIYRFGGEEFMVVMPVATTQGLLAAAERLRAAVELLGIAQPDPASQGVVTVSIGATLLGATSLGRTDDEWFELVDRAMYAAKHAGRNQVRVVEGIDP